MKREKYNGKNGIAKGAKMRYFNFKKEFIKPKRKVSVGVGFDGSVLIETELFKKGKIVHSKVRYTNEVVGFILSAIFSGGELISKRNEPVKTKKIVVDCSECGKTFEQTIRDYGSKKLTTDDYDEYCEECNKRASR
jgi:hypothetical protein